MLQDPSERQPIRLVYNTADKNFQTNRANDVKRSILRKIRQNCWSQSTISERHPWSTNTELINERSTVKEKSVVFDVDSSNASILRCSINSSMKPSAFRDGESYQKSSTTRKRSADKKTNLNILNGSLSIFLAGDDRSEMRFSVHDYRKRITSAALQKAVENTTTISNAIKSTDQLIHVLHSYCEKNAAGGNSGDANGSNKFSSAKKADGVPQLQSLATRILETHVLQFVSSDKVSCFNSALERLSEWRSSEGYWKRRKARAGSSQSRMELHSVPPTLLESLEFQIEVSAGKKTTPRNEIAVLELLTQTYAIQLLQTKKLLQAVIETLEITETAEFCDHQLVLACVEGLLMSSVSSNNAELVVGLDRIIKTIVYRDPTRCRATEKWCIYLAKKLANDYSIARLFVEEVRDICATVNDTPSWLTIFNTDRPTGAIASRDSTSTYGNETRGTTRRSATQNTVLLSLADADTDLGNDDGLKQWLHHARVSLSQNVREHLQGHVSSRSRVLRKACRVKRKASKAIDAARTHRGPISFLRDLVGKTKRHQPTPPPEIRSVWHQRPAPDTTYFCDNTTYSDVVIKPSRCAYLRQKKDRFMFVFFGEEKWG
ncbi:LAMI_0B02828g1_1 [Lachancea mirantina]|uniref:LAMI_0B02828g1_1 n=1 Tax=Lachancea mirantina TaxID=1230905 RepID=A0A1G4IU33_9SACH|nr:LAMI_0B02828g1_1 [Lachancea mirantina]